MEVDEGGRAHAANLEKVGHVVVVMLENRSFDHMLGYLSLSGRRPEIDGLRPGLTNQYQGRTYPVHHLGATALGIDPDHSAGAIDQQVAGGDMSGFVASAAATIAGRGVRDGDPGCVMGHYDGTDVPVYDHLAEEFAICDRWFSSVPGSTLPNRLYALCGVAAGSRDDRPLHVPPLYHQPSFARHLDAHHISWRWYSFDPGTLRLADAHYLLGHHQRFGYFSKAGLPWKAVFDISCNPKIPSFLEDAAAGTLRSVSWIDPAFTNFKGGAGAEEARAPIERAIDAPPAASRCAQGRGNASNHCYQAVLAMSGSAPNGDQCHLERRQQMASTRIIRAVLLVAAAAILAVAAAQLRDKRKTAELTVENIHEQLDALDPVTRAAVVARLSSDEVKKIRDRP
jgi:phospholipase C